MKKLILFTIGFLTLGTLMSQSIERQLFGTAGSQNSGDQINLEWVIGETFTSLNELEFGIYKAGFLQPQNIFDEQDLDNLKIETRHTSAQVFPNPFNNSFLFQLDESLDNDSKLTLLDYSGKIVARKTLAANTFSLEWNLTHYTSGLYFLQFTTKNGEVKNSFKLVKL